MKLIDLTHTLSSDTVSWDGDCGFNLSTTTDYIDCTPPNLFRVQKIEMRAGMGTHMDAPAHCIPGGKTIDALPLTDLVTECIVIDVSKEADEKYVAMPEVVARFEEKYGMIPQGSFVIFYTGWSMRWDNKEKYRNNLQFPSIHEDTAKLLLERNIAELGAETSNKYGINGASINAANSSEGFLIEKSYISNSHRSIRCDSCTNLDQINTSGAINNYIYNFSQEGVDFGGTTNTEITGNRIDTGNVGNGDGIIHYAAYNGLVYNNIVTNTIYGIVANLGSGHDIVGNKVYDATTYELYNTDSEENSWIDNDAFGATAQGIYVPTTENIYLGSNQVDIGTVALDITNASATNFVAAEEAYGYYSGLSTADVRYGSTDAHHLKVFDHKRSIGL
jgi:kynurenine formamidase